GVEPITPHNGVTYAATFMQPPVHAVLPSWTRHVSSSPEGTWLTIEEQQGCARPNGESPCPADADLKLRLLPLRYFYPDGEPTLVANPSYADYVGAWDDLGPSGFARISDRSSVTVGGRPATVMSLVVLRDAPGSIGCPFREAHAVDCAGIVTG